MQSKITGILIVDDEPDLCTILQEMIAAHGFRTRIASSGFEALDILRQDQFQVVLSDIQMPIMTGLELLAKAVAAGIYTPFVFLTAYSDKEKLLEAVRLGATDFLFKPFSHEEVENVIFRASEIGNREDKIRSILESHPEVHNKIKEQEKMIRLTRLVNNSKRKVA